MACQRALDDHGGGVECERGCGLMSMNQSARTEEQDVPDRVAGGAAVPKPFTLTIVCSVISIVCYVALARAIVPRMAPAAPTRVGEVFRWIPPLGWDDLNALREGSAVAA